MKHDIAWHQSCLKNHAETLESYRRDIERKMAQLARCQRDFDFYASQIAEAVRQNKTEFDSTRFLTKRGNKP